MAEVNGVTVEHCVISRENAGKGECTVNEPGASAPEDMSSKDYYFDSYAHFGIHEVSCFVVNVYHSSVHPSVNPSVHLSICFHSIF